jgi:FkbM family methyltransferase
MDEILAHKLALPSNVKLDPNICIIEDMWWSMDDLPAYPYLLKTNKDFISKITPHLKGTDTAVQAGGHCGWMVRELNKEFKDLYIFEPNNTMFTCLCLNLPGDNIFKFQACVGNEHKLVGMDVQPKAAGAGFINGIGRIPMLKIDDLNLEHCDFIQLDLEGFEYNALLGAENTISKFRPLLCLERYWGYRYGSTEVNFSSFLTKYGYKEVAALGESDHIYKSN